MHVQAGQQFFSELDSDGDGVVQQADVARVLRKRNLPERYAKDFIAKARGNRWWQTTVTWVSILSAVLQPVQMGCIQLLETRAC